MSEHVYTDLCMPTIYIAGYTFLTMRPRVGVRTVRLNQPTDGREADAVTWPA
jgi:hypothetical protein